MQSIQSMESRLDSVLNVLQSADRGTSRNDSIILRHKIPFAITMATFSANSKWLAYVTVCDCNVNIFEMPSVASQEATPFTIQIIPTDVCDKGERGIHCMAFTTDETCLCVGVDDPLFRKHLLEFHVIRLPLGGTGVHTEIIQVGALLNEPRSPDEFSEDIYPLPKASCKKNVFFFLNQDNLCTVNDKFFTDTNQSTGAATAVGKTMNSTGQVTVECKKGYAVCDKQDFVACLNDSSISVYSFSLKDGGVNLTQFQTIHMNILIKTRIEIIMNPVYIVVYVVGKETFYLLRRVDNEKKWVPCLIDVAKSGIKHNLFFNANEPSRLYMVKGKKCSILNLDTTFVSVYTKFENAVRRDESDFIHRVVCSEKYTGVCSMGMLTVFNLQPLSQPIQESPWARVRGRH
jgi:hypothetical protein